MRHFSVREAVSDAGGHDDDQHRSGHLGDDPGFRRAAAGRPGVARSGPVLPIGIDTLCSSALLEFDVYIQQEPEGPLTLYRASHYPMAEDDFERLRARGIQTLYIQSADVAGYQHYLQEHVLPERTGLADPAVQDPAGGDAGRLPRVARSRAGPARW